MVFLLFPSLPPPSHDVKYFERSLNRKTDDNIIQVTHLTLRQTAKFQTSPTESI